MRLIKCEFCNIEFETKSPVVRFCGSSCSGKFTKNKKKTGTIVNCANCGQEYYKQLSQTKKCCSHKCASDYKTGKPINGKTGRMLQCKHCNELYYCQYHRLKSSKYCSMQCYSRTDSMKYSPNFNPEACNIIEEYGRNNGYNFQHALNGGEYRIPGTFYSVDGYDAEKNVIIEIDEPQHFDAHGNLKHRDVIRQNKIESILNCKFIRIKL
jgi:hypothetical protein